VASVFLVVEMVLVVQLVILLVPSVLFQVAVLV